jgi:hypothetical protein
MKELILQWRCFILCCLPFRGLLNSYTQSALKNLELYFLYLCYELRTILRENILLICEEYQHFVFNMIKNQVNIPM